MVRSKGSQYGRWVALGGCVVAVGLVLLGGCSEDVSQPEAVDPTILSVGPDSIQFGLDLEAAEIQVSTTGPDSLHWALGRSAGWVRISPTAGSLSNGTDTLTVTVVRSGLDSGVHIAAVWIDAGDAGCDTVYVSVELPSAGMVSGHVFFAGTRIPIEGATVSVEEQSTVSGADGSFALPEAPVGRHTIRATRDGFDDFALSIWIPGQGLTRDLGMVSDLHTYSLQGRVSNEASGGAEMVLVTMLNPDGSESDLRVRTAMDGEYQLQGVPAGLRQLRYEHRLYDEMTADVTVSGDMVAPEVQLQAAVLPPPQPESGPHIFRIDCTTLRIVWVPRQEDTVLGYRVERAAQASGPYVDVSGLIADRTAGYFDDQGHRTATTYYRVRTENIGHRLGEPSVPQQSAPQPWVLLNDGTGGPLGRTGHVLVYDAPANRVVMHAGMGCTCDLCGVIFADTWGFDLVTRTWSRLGSECPPGHRHNHAGICDEARGRLVIFGGRPTTLSVLEDVWQMDFATDSWSRISTGTYGPSARCRHRATYDPIGDRMIVYGGFDGSTPVNDVWALDLAEHRWEQLRTGEYGELPLQPEPRYFHAAVFDPVGYRMIIFGGARYLTWDYPSLDDTWALDLTDYTWERLGDGPPGRHSHVLSYVPATHSVILYGGGGEGYQRFSDTWELHLSDGHWEQVLSNSRPGALVHPEVVMDETGAIILFGGLDEIRPMPTTWAYCPGP